MQIDKIMQAVLVHCKGLKIKIFRYFIVNNKNHHYEQLQTLAIHIIYITDTSKTFSWVTWTYMLSYVGVV